MDELNTQGALKFSVDGADIELSEEDLLIEMTKQEGYESLGEGNITVVLDTKLTPELIEEGFVREIVSQVQTMRKEAGFHVTDHIAITMAGSDSVLAIANSRKAEITGDTLADTLSQATPDGYTKEWDINGETVTIGVQKI